MAVRHSVPLTFRKYSVTRRAVSFIVGLNLPLMLHLLRIGGYSLKTGVEYLVLHVRRWMNYEIQAGEILLHLK